MKKISENSRNPGGSRLLSPVLSVMKNSRRIAARHRRTRQDHSTETAEDYVEAVAEISAETGTCRVVDLAQRFDVSHVTVTRIVGRLKRDGYVDTEPYRPIQLTQKGTRLAAASKRRHDVVYRFLLSIGVSEKTAAIDAEGIEHHVSPETLEVFSTLADQVSQGQSVLSSLCVRETP